MEMRDGTAWQTLVRELNEELGLQERHVQYVNHVVANHYIMKHRRFICSVIFIVTIEGMTFDLWHSLRGSTKFDFFSDPRLNVGAFGGEIIFRDFHQRHMRALGRIPGMPALLYVMIEIDDELHATIGDYIDSEDLEEVLEIVGDVQYASFQASGISHDLRGVDTATIVTAIGPEWEIIIRRLFDMRIPGWASTVRKLHISHCEKRSGTFVGRALYVRVGNKVVFGKGLAGHSLPKPIG